MCSKIKTKLIAKIKTGQNLLQNHQNIGACLKYYFKHEIFASNQKCMRTSQNICAYQNIRFQSNICAHLDLPAQTQNIPSHENIRLHLKYSHPI